MKLPISVLISAVFLFGLVTMGMAQTSSDTSSSPSPSAPSASSAPSAPSSSSEPAKSSPDVKADVKTDNRSTTVESRSDSSGRSDGGSALPRAATERSTIFGLSSTAAIIVGGALLLVVILAIVALGRGGSSDVYVDRDRRM
jgi:cobalamin biosynthesis Mg chelatase CobN